METKIKLQLGSKAGQEFAKFLEKEIKAGRISKEYQVQFKTGGRAAGGLGLAIPPEVIIAFASGITGAMASEIGKTLWSKIREFLGKKQDIIPQTESVIIVQNEQFVFNPKQMDEEPPSELIEWGDT
ncbi:MAG: hypothetical protein AMJ73_04500 [candidate division Zixibacteria bacterium SM1_73]|nr:MAG: hypothetical protein AMJ73_04500 [candidate division Zixibacteria bacterium SM1_73]